MLEQLIIENFAIIDKVDLIFYPGMSVLTGETGAGKSIIIDALSMLMGARASSEMIRRGTTKAVLQAVFHIGNDSILNAVLEDQGIEVEDQQLIIYRELNRNGRSTIRVNGMVINLKALAQIGPYLVDIQGQHDTQRLLDPDQHLAILDQFGGAELVRVKDQYQHVFKQFQQITQKINNLKHNQQASNQRLDLLKFQQAELADAQLKTGEEEQLMAERAKLTNFKKIADNLQIANESLGDGPTGGIIDLLAQTKTALDTAAQFDDSYQNLALTVTDSYYTAQEAGRDLAERLDSLTYDEEALVKIDDRLQLIHQLERKYGDNLEQVLAFQQQVESELAKLDQGEFDLPQLETKQSELRQVVGQAAQKLRVIRQRTAKQLADDVNQQLRDLLMPEARFVVDFKPVEGFVLAGNDRVSFLVQTNAGEGLAPLVKIASGGETARLMLALKTILTKQEMVGTVVFDEIDTGVSGRVAGAIASKMKAIARNCQVLAITHLPQVAAAADQHYYIQKQSVDKRTITQVQRLDEEGRIEALALMLSGDKITPEAIENARVLRNDK